MQSMDEVLKFIDSQLEVHMCPNTIESNKILTTLKKFNVLTLHKLGSTNILTNMRN
jgi:hypothetical protein